MECFELLSFSVQVPTALVSLVDSDRQWFKSHTVRVLSPAPTVQCGILKRLRELPTDLPQGFG